MKVALLGASGQLGREWQARFRDESDSGGNFLTYTSSQLDITDQKRVGDELRSQNPDIIINCAAYTDVDGAEDHREKAHKVNAEAVAGLAELSAELDCMLVHYSTDYVFPGAPDDRTRFPDGYPEDHPTNPINYYGKTKLQGEEAIRASGCPHLIIRVAWLCGAFGSNFVKTMLQLGRERDRLEVVNDQWGSPTFAENVVFNSWQLLKAGQYGTFHITSHGLITWYDFARAVFETAGVDVEMEPVSSDHFPTVAKRPRFSKLSTEKLRAVSAASIEDWTDGLERLLHQLQNF